MDQIVTKAGAHPILLDALCRAVHRYLDEHPHLALRDLRQTMKTFETLIMALDHADGPDWDMLG